MNVNAIQALHDTDDNLEPQVYLNVGRMLQRIERQYQQDEYDFWPSVKNDWAYRIIVNEARRIVHMNRPDHLTEDDLVSVATHRAIDTLNLLELRNA